MVPIAFVSEHSETLVELDIEYKHIAGEAGVPAYIRVPTASVEEDFITGLGGAGASGRPRIPPNACRKPAADCALRQFQKLFLQGICMTLLWLKAFHVIAVIAWMAGMLYLPRLYVYHTEVGARIA